MWHYPKVWMGLFFFAVAAGFCLGYVVLGSRGKPHLMEARPGKIDLGTVGLGVESGGSVELVNLGESSVEIAGAFPSCGCTIANITQKKIAPHGSTQLVYKIKGSFKEKPIDGQIAIEWHATSEPQKDRTLIVPMTGQYDSKLGVVPRIIYHDASTGEFQDRIDVSIVQKEMGQGFPDLRASVDGTELKLAQRKKSDGEYQVVVEGNIESFPMGITRRNLRVQCENVSSKDGYDRVVPIIIRRYRDKMAIELEEKENKVQGSFSASVPDGVCSGGP